MCLTIPLFSRIQTATEDITVYKVLQSKWGYHPNKVWATPFQMMTVELSAEKVITSDLTRHIARVSKGLHSYTNVDDAYEVAMHFSKGKTRARVFRALIPKGAKYYKGKHRLPSWISETSLSSIASNKLIITSQYA